MLDMPNPHALRAALQRAITTEIREIDRDAAATAALQIRGVIPRSRQRNTLVTALAAACLDDAIWDAVAQVRQQILFEREERR